MDAFEGAAETGGDSKAGSAKETEGNEETGGASSTRNASTLLANESC